MKKIIALLLSIAMVFCFAVTAFAADSPSADKKTTVTIRKADVIEPAGQVVDTEYTVEAGTIITVKANSKYGTFKDWSIYKETASTTTGMITLNVVNLATSKFVDAVSGTDYEVIKGSLTTEELTIKVNSSVVICANYDGVKTDPSAPSKGDTSNSAPQTGDMFAAYAVVIMLAVVAFGFGVKKVYSK